jgi:hypothetical protein
VNGAVSTPQEVYDVAAATEPGTIVRYELSKDGTRRGGVLTERFEVRDWILLFGAYLLNSIVSPDLWAHGVGPPAVPDAGARVSDVRDRLGGLLPDRDGSVRTVDPRPYSLHGGPAGVGGGAAALHALPPAHGSIAGASPATFLPSPSGPRSSSTPTTSSTFSTILMVDMLDDGMIGIFLGLRLMATYW